jgi:iron-sulfur cluster assembly protein
MQKEYRPLTNFLINANAHEHIDNLLGKNDDLNNPFLRIMVEAGGCAGLKYHIIMDDYISENDFAIEKNDKPYLVIDEWSLEYVKNGELIYEETFESSGFKVLNPNVTGNCSCGSSFSCSGS